jgi:hypothetical protein
VIGQYYTTKPVDEDEQTQIEQFLMARDTPMIVTRHGRTCQKIKYKEGRIHRITSTTNRTAKNVRGGTR